MTFTCNQQTNIINGFSILENPLKVVSFMVLLLLVLKLLQCLTPDGGHLGLSNMAATGGVQLGSLWKLVDYSHISPWSKNGACGTI